MNHLELAYIGVEVADPDGVGAVLGGVAGMVPGEPAGALRTWRNDDAAPRILVREGDADDAFVIGFEAADAEAFDAVVARLSAAGMPADEDPTLATERKVERLVRTVAPWGVPVEIVLGLDRIGGFDAPDAPGGFKTAGVGFGHTVFMVPDPRAADEFAVGVLGMRQTDWLELAVAPDVTITGRFYHCNPRHHTMALIGAPAPKHLHHVMVEMNDPDDVGAAYDRAFRAGIPIASGLGKHDNDKMTSFYVETPAGFQVEVGSGAREVADDWAENRAYDRISVWGHQPVALRG
jgi:2,3-dihydroxybiphenyl 1,2-dioxygenase